MIRKAVIPAAGLGTRMLPAAKAVPKELLPVLDRPAIQYVVEECAAAGVADVLLVTGRGKSAIEDHFDRHGELEARLAAGGPTKRALLASLDALMARVTITSVRQPEQRGLGDAVLRAKGHVGDEPFLCLLGDAVFSGDPMPAEQLLAVHAIYGGSVIGLEEVPAEKVNRYGIVGGEFVADGVIRATAVVEKPSVAEAPSRLAIAARYVLSPSIFRYLEKTPPGQGGEVQLTDAIKLMMADEPVFGVVLKAKRHDVGDRADWLKTNLHFARRDEALWADLAPLLRELLAD